MSNQGGLKHVATEPTRLESKRERRRGAAGRAAALRRAPSDSDCSGETASLSADSGDRAIRPAPQPPPRGKSRRNRAKRPAPPPPSSGKSRSRRRGSEWEVLEGLKDGQRFDKRPEVFNGYLHKKRKWPLKGWHKRFFVVDGGILVYARSPTDVARGRLHGSVDVGLSVISAKARRRRIDIDADEFIYHLRAKTPDVFRTWLTVLKAHRLYRQHLLTFGARESVPKIHAPLEDLPQTDTSSRATQSSIEITTLSSLHKIQNLTLPLTYVPSTTPVVPFDLNSPVYENKSQIPMINWPCVNRSSTLLPLKFDELSNDGLESIWPYKNDGQRSFNSVDLSLCPADISPISKDTSNKSPFSLQTTDAEKQMHSTDLEWNLMSPDIKLSLCEYYSYTINKDQPMSVREQNQSSSFETEPVIGKDRTVSLPNKVEPIVTYCFSTHKTRQDVNPSPMKRSRKSTNLVKYRNVSSEPPLKRPFNNTLLLLGNYSTKLTKESRNVKKCDNSTICNIVSQSNIEIQAEVEDKGNKTANVITTSELDRITEKLMMSIFEKMENSCDSKNINIKSCINQVVKELYDSKVTSNDTHPVIALFKCLLEYWLKNTSLSSVREAVRRAKSIDRQSNKHFTKDENTSSDNIENINKQTQFHGMSDIVNKNISKMLIDIINKKGRHKPRGLRIHNDNSEKERQIQELERILKNTVYVCETSRGRSIEKDIKITKTLINNLDNMSQKCVRKQSNNNANLDNTNSSSELVKIQATINHLISETALPLAVAKDFLNAYLGLLNNGSYSSSESPDKSKSDTIPKGDVQTESVQKKTSIGITTKETTEIDPRKPSNQNVDPGQLYLKSMLDHITSIFCKSDQHFKIQCNAKEKDSNCGDIKDESKKDTRENSMEINLSNYNVEHVSMMSNPDLKKIASITMKLKNKHSKPEQTPGSLLRINFSDTIAEKLKDRKYLDENNIEAKIKVPSYETNMFKQFDLKPYSTSSDATSKDYRIVNTDQSLNLDIEKEKSQKFSNSVEPLRIENDIESCYVFSSLKCAFQGKKYDTADKMEQTHVNLNTGYVFPDDLAMFEKAPKTIDEKFILLLLENVSLLSKNLPAIHKDINGFYLRLRKKFEKVIKNQDTSINIQGVGLLGKIYSDEFKSKSFNDTETQFEKSVYDKRNRDVAIETSSITSANKSDKALSTDMVTPEHVDIQTEEYDCGYFQKKYDEQNNFSGSVREIYNANTSRSPTISSISERKDDAIAMEKAISNQNWYRKICTKDCGISAIILDKDENSRNLRIKAKTVNNQLQFKIDKESTGKSLKSDKENSSKMKQDLIKQISMLPPSVKVSTQQTDECIRNNIDVFELFNSVKYSGKKSSSMIEINAENREMSDDLKTIYRCTSYPSFCSGLASPTGAVRTQAGFVSGTPGGRLAGWIIESGGPLESASRELGQAQLSVQQLQRLLDALELHQQTHHDTDVSLEGASPNVKKDRRKFGLRKKKSNSKCASVELQPPHIDPSASHMTLSALTAPPSPGGGASSIPNSAASLPIACAATRPQSLPGAEALGAAGPASLSSLTPDHQLREDFTVLAKDLVASLKAVVSTLVCERGRLRAAMEAAEAGGAAGGAVVAALRTNLSTALHQNSELRARLARIHDASDLADVSSLGRNSEPNRHIHQSLSYSSSCVSASEFFDAEEHEDDDLKPAEIIDADEAGVIELDGDSSSEAGSLSSEEGSASSDNSDAASIAVVGTEAHPLASGGGGGGGGGAGGGGWARRTGLPAPRPTPGGPSLWNLLYKNIGKDLSQVSMPVTINEPLNMLQRLCEELEYSELLDAAAACPNGIERMALVSAFAVSAYAAAAHRAASKPFNPLLAETYECVREDRGFRFIAEQVSHHPPISACHAESPRWVFWQEARIKTKFWGKSMEFQPAGRVHVRLLTTGDHYSWNKVTTCVHNLFGGQRWVDQYGDMLVVCHGTDIACKLNFIKASSWSSSRHEVRGAVSEGSTRLRLQGRWSEALHAGDPPAARCLWRPGAMPPEHEMYYGFTRFAMELNELEPGMRDVLPHTDTRLRPDQRALEEGDVDTAERLKHQLEQAQRERRRDRPDPAPVWFRKTIEGGEETWVFTGEYWRARDAGFPHNPAPRLW